jgi:hypothetical protein
MTKVQGGSCDNPLTSFSYHCILLHIEIFIAIGPIKKMKVSSTLFVHDLHYYYCYFK